MNAGKGGFQEHGNDKVEDSGGHCRHFGMRIYNQVIEVCEHEKDLVEELSMLFLQVRIWRSDTGHPFIEGTVGHVF